ncbi:hypothetical protein OX283_010355 [Flavobacterium sp. SUN052]|uniref:hypothetical protein n=1 Tax=Flavobacterium sp. SUN052 TaxID=3002441 RepID=UPI00237E724E|nr:hypothetical protein [Flavobacterium sp. SUN052]MEC4005060.1 hypothetical protein [Flavobacterium sp. SUN052]
MKKTIAFALIILSLCSFSVNTFKPFNFVGKWEAIGDKDKGSGFIFDADGYAFMFKNGEKLGGKNFNIKGQKGDMYYVINQNNNPITIDIVVSFKDAKKGKKKMMMLVKIVDNNTISLAAADEVRPTKFTKENTITFKRE